MHVRFISNSKLAVCMNVSVNDCLSVLALQNTSDLSRVCLAIGQILARIGFSSPKSCTSGYFDSVMFQVQSI